MSKVVVLIGLIMAWPGPWGGVQACSTFLLKRSDALVVGHNLDQPNIRLQPGLVVINKRGIEKEARTWLDLTSNQKPGKRIRWVSKYGSVTCNAMGREFPDGGMNEAGLVVCEMTLAGTRFPKGEGLSEMFLVQWIQYLLDTCGSVEEATHSAKSVALTGWDNAWHFFVADATGKAAVIEFLDAKPVIYEGDSLPIPVLCNSQYAKELKQIKAYRGFGGRKRISKSDPEPRFLFAADMLKKDNGSKPASRYAFSILDRMDTCTQWSVVYDIRNRRLDFRTSVARDIRGLSMSDFDFSCDKPALAVNINSDLKGDIGATLKPCTTEVNRGFVEKDIDRISQMGPWLMEMLSSQGMTKQKFIDRLATYPESTKCREVSSRAFPPQSDTPIAIQTTTSDYHTLVLTHATVIDATGSPPKPDMMVVVRNDRIVALGKTGKLAIPRNSQVLDATGKFLIPGLWDMHVHLWLDKCYLGLFTANGVTGIRVMQGEPKHHKWHKEISAGKLVGPRMVIASKILDGPDNPLGFDSVRNAEDGRRIVRKSKVEGADFIKVYNHLPRDTYFAIVDEAKKQGIPFAGHVPYSVSVAEASDAGQQSIEHYFCILQGCSSIEGRLKKASMNKLAYNFHLLLDSYSSKKAAGLFARFVENGTWACPTNALKYGFWFGDEQDLQDLANEPGLKYVPCSMAEEWHSRLDARTAMSTEERTTSQISRQRAFDALNAMRRSGVGLLAGTDTPVNFCLPGFALHKELEIFVEAGLSPMEALQTATCNPAKFFGKLDSMGTIEQGKIADMVLLDANPLENISNTRRIAAVVSGGKILDKTGLQEVFAQLKASRLHIAAAEGQIEHLKSLIAEGSDVNARDQNGRTLLQVALSVSKLPVIDVLLKNGADPNDPYLAAYTGDINSIKKLFESNTPVERIDGFTLLHAAASGGRLDIIELLIAKGFSVTATARKNTTPLHYAVAHNHKEVAQALIANGAQLESGDRTPLAWAALRGHRDMAELLLAKGADVNAKDRWVMTSLHYACMMDRKEVAEFLVSTGADINTTDYEGPTPLHVAAEWGHKDLAGLLLARGADVEAKDNSGKTPLHLAARWDHKDMVELLLAKGSDINTADYKGRLPLHLGARWGHTEVVGLLIAKDADVEAKDNDGKTPLHLAAGNDHKDVAELLLAKGSDVNSRDKQGWTPLYNTYWKNPKDMAELLLAKGADINAKTQDGWTTLHNVCWNNGKDMAEFLVSKGADITAKNHQGESPLSIAESHGYKEIVEIFRNHRAKDQDQ